MSGIEVVGLVLAALPLVVKGLKHYSEGVETIAVIRHAAADFRTVAMKLDAENIAFQNALDILLQDTVDIKTQQRLLQDIGGNPWADPTVEKALQRRLQLSYPSYIDHVKAIHEELKAVSDKLQIDENGKGPFTSDAVSFRNAFKRFKFALKKSAYLDNIREIRSNNRHLERLTTQSHLLSDRKRCLRSPDFGEIRASAANLFHCLQKALHVSCATSHKASICLPSQSTAADETSFRIVLQHGSPHAQQSGLWLSEETEIRVVQIIIPEKQILPMTQGAAARISRPVGGKKSVGFAQKSRSALAPKDALQATTDTPVSSKEIKDLCQQIPHLSNLGNGNYLGYVTLSDLHRHEVYKPVERLLDGDRYVIRSLDAIICQRQSTRRRLTSGDAHRLALALATGVLRLHDTPWLKVDWNKHDIHIVEKNGKLVAQHPLLSRELQAYDAQTIQATSGIIRNPTLFALGILLIELCIGDSIEALHDADGSGNVQLSDLDRFKTAARLLANDEISDRFGKRYHDVVSRCIYCDLNQTKQSLEDAAFRAAVYANIVLELEEGYRLFFGLDEGWTGLCNKQDMQLK